MFFSNDLLRGKGRLGNLWYAAWRVHKLRKQAILDFKIADGAVSVFACLWALPYFCAA